MTGTAPRASAPSAEVALLLRCVAAAAHEPVTEIERLSSCVTDWPRFIELAERHAVIPLVGRQLARLPDGRVPEQIISRSRAVAREAALRGLRLTGQLVSIVQMLSESAVEAMPIKGPTLALLVYGDLSLRLYEDLDILVHRADVGAAARALVGLGYREIKTFNDSRDALIPETHHATFFSESRAPVELHWSLTHRTLARDALEAQWWQSRRDLTLGGATIRTLGPEPLVLYLCMHGAKHSWARIGWLADLQQTLRAFDQLEWDIVWRIAHEAGATRMVTVGLLLIGELLDGELLIARAFANRMPDLASRELVATIANRLRLAPDVLPGIDYSVQMRMRDSWSDRARFAIHILAEPWPADVSALRLPLTLRGAYYLFRPLRLAWKYLLHRDRLPRAA